MASALEKVVQAMSNLSSIEQKLYRANFKSEDLRQQSYLAVHATVSRNKEVPRAYIVNKQHSESDLDRVLTHLLIIDHTKSVELTNKLITSLQISTKQILSLNAEEKEELLATIEDLLLNGWGKGEVYYEKLRLSPNNQCNLTDWIKTQKTINLEKYAKLLSLLSKRIDDSQIYIETLNKVFTSGNRRYNPTILSKSYELLLEKNWRNNWANNSNYLILPDEEALLSNLLFMEEI
jgi:hypothetical protein